MNIFSTEGRIGRGEHFLAILIASIVSAAVSVGIWYFGLLDEKTARFVGYLVAALLMICPAVQRLHDTNHSGVALLFALIPLVNLGLGLYLLLKSGTNCPNRYGTRTGLPESSPLNSGGQAAHSAAASGNEELEERQITDAFYDEVAKEMQEDRLIPGVWTRAFAEADGDENRAKAIYIKTRVAQLLEQEREQLTQEERVVEQKRLADVKNIEKSIKQSLEK